MLQSGRDYQEPLECECHLPEKLFMRCLGRTPLDAMWTNARRFVLALVLMAAGIADMRAATVLAVVGDWGVSGTAASNVANMVGSSSWQSDYVLTVGDNNYGNVAAGSQDWENL